MSLLLSNFFVTVMKYLKLLHPFFLNAIAATCVSGRQVSELQSSETKRKRDREKNEYICLSIIQLIHSAEGAGGQNRGSAKSRAAPLNVFDEI